MSPNISNRRPDGYGPVEPWKPVKTTDADIRDRLTKLMAAGKMAAQFTPDPTDDAVFAALELLSREPKFIRAIRAVVDALPQHRPAVVQQLFGEGL